MAKKQTEFDQKLDCLKSQITALQEAAKEIKESGLRESLFLTALQRAAQKHLEGYASCKPIGIRYIKAILNGIEDIKEYMFPTEDGERNNNA